jgi:3-hydroxyisobutyrate dehydrogenase-like beta-hydroxyacid dehydrogenase
MASELNLGFIGFGEAGYHIARGLREAGLLNIAAYDINAQTAAHGEKIQQRATTSGVTLVASNAELAERCDILLSTVTANRAREAAEQTAPYLGVRHLYSDLNSVSPDLKRTINQIIEARGARFVEIAIMSPVPPHGHRVPMFLCGRNAQALSDQLSPFGMKLEIISDQIGAASATKMCRSIIVKGLEALLLECVLGAVPYGADERVFATLEETMPGMNWEKMASYMVGRVVEHGERRARELEEVAATLRAIGVEPIMAEAIVKRQDDCARLNLLAEFGGKVPNDYQTIVAAIRSAQTQRSQND